MARSASYSPTGAVLRATLLPAIYEPMSARGLSVTDFGGGTGELGADFLAAYPGSRFTVVEHPGLVAAMAGREGPVFSTEIPAKCDLFYTSGTLQYLENPMEMLEKGLKSAWLGAILRRNNFCDVENFEIQRARLFENGAGPIPEGFQDGEIRFPRRTLREADVIDLARACGLECIVNMDDAEQPAGVGYSRQLIFWRT